MTAIVLTLSVMCMIGGFLLFMALIPIAYAYVYAKSEIDKETITNNLKIARTNKVLADQEVLESRRAKLDSEVAILELRIEEKRRNLGLDQDFHPDNY